MDIRLRLPGSTSNLGPGFDALGLALTIYNRIILCTRSDTDVNILVRGEGSDVLPSDQTNLFYQAAQATAKKAGKSLPGMDVEMVNDIPLARGLGSSSTAIVGGVTAANMLIDNPFSKSDVLDIANELEGHPDNVSPCLQGGLTISTVENGSVQCLRALPPDHLKAVVAVPDFELQTEAARSALPQTVPYRDAVFNIGRACLVTSALLLGDLDALKIGMHDRLHQPYRSCLIPGFDRVLDAARQQGALGTALSGAGPTLLAFATENAEAIGQAMVNAWQKDNIVARAHVLNIDSE
ncbi:MAG: homoserine kinase [bacterium]|nr:homoserine kinase [bacterium]